MPADRPPSSPKNRKLLWLSAAAALLLIAACAAFFWWRTEKNREIATASLPKTLNLQDKKPQLLLRVKECERRIRAGQDVKASLAELASLFHGNGLYAEAARCYQGLVRIDSGNPRWPHLMANILAGFGQLDDAVLLWRRTLSLKKDYTPAQIHLADSLLKLNQSQEAIRVYEQILKREPENAYALLGLARFDMEAGRWASARERLEAAVSSSDYSIGYDLLVTVCEHQGDNARALAIRARCKASGAFADIPDPWLREIYDDCYDGYILSIAAGVAEAQADIPFAVKLVDRALTLEPNNGYYYVQDYLLCLQRKDAPRGLQYLLKGTRDAPTCPEVWHELALYYRNIHQDQQALQAALTGLSYCPDSPSLHFVRGEYLEAAGRYDEAIRDFEQTATIKNDDGSPHLSLAKIYFILNRPDDGLKELNKALLAEPDFPPAITVFTTYYIGIHDEAAARKWMQRVKNQPRITDRERSGLESAFLQQFGSSPY